MNRVQKLYKEKCETISDINEHLPVLHKLAKDNEVVEMGVRWVVSTWAWIAGGCSKITAYDIVNPQRWGISVEYIADIASEAGAPFEFKQEDSTKCEIPNTDILFIDTWHVYEQLKAELNLHHTKVRKMIILHDTQIFGDRGETEGHKGLRPAIKEFLEENPQWKIHKEYHNNNGLMILSRV